MDIQEIKELAAEAIKDSGGVVNYAYFKGYCDCFDKCNNQKMGTTYSVIKPFINETCLKYKHNPLVYFK